MKPVLALVLLSAPLLAQDPGRWNFNFGGGPSFATGDAGRSVNTGYTFTAGGGINLNKHLGFAVDYTFDGFGLSDQALRVSGAPDGYAHAWGFTFDPIYRFAPGKKVGGYVTGGYGVFTRTINLTRPGLVPATICDPWTFICYSGAVVADVVYRSNSVTKGAWDIGGGLTYRLGESNANFYVELRYFDMLTSGVHSTFLPLTFGLRW